MINEVHFTASSLKGVNSCYHLKFCLLYDPRDLVRVIPRDLVRVILLFLLRNKRIQWLDCVSSVSRTPSTINCHVQLVSSVSSPSKTRKGKKKKYMSTTSCCLVEDFVFLSPF